MAIRVYICPVVGTGTSSDGWRSKAVDLVRVGGVMPAGVFVSNFIPIKDGTPASPWTLTVVYGTSDFSALDTDPSCDDLFGGNIPAAIQSRDDLITYLRANTVADVPLARRQAIQAVLTKYGVVQSDFVGTTPLWRVFRRVASTLDEQDDNFASMF